jgi:hypothetical protein
VGAAAPPEAGAGEVVCGLPHAATARLAAAQADVKVRPCRPSITLFPFAVT